MDSRSFLRALFKMDAQNKLENEGSQSHSPSFGLKAQNVSLRQLIKSAQRCLIVLIHMHTAFVNASCKKLAEGNTAGY